MYKSPYYNPVLNRADYTYDIAGYDSYGAPVLSPVEAPAYTDYSGYSSATGTGVIINRELII